MIINERFYKVYCINLEKRKDRLRRFSNRSKSNDVTFERFDAVSPTEKPNGYINNGELGCLSSHLEIIKEAHEKKNG